MNRQRAYEVASSWGSYIHAADPGACFYGFLPDDGRPLSEEHRQACVTYARDRLDRVRVSRAGGFGTVWTEAEEEEADRTATDLEDLITFFEATELHPSAYH